MEEMKKSSEEKLIKKAIRGSDQAFTQLIMSYKEYLYRTAWLYCKDQEVALEAVQECVARSYEKIVTLREPALFRTWLTRILLNAVTDQYRKQSRLIYLEEQPEQAAREEHISQEEKMDLHAAVERLPEKQRVAVILKYFQDLKISEISAIMEIPEGSVKAYLHQARKRLREDLGREENYA